MEYSYGFDEDLQQEWEWTERYAPQPEILALRRPRRRPLRPPPRHPLRHPGHRGDLRRGRRHAGRSAPTRATSVSARFVVMATGCLSSANIPDIPGADSFAGPDLPHRPVAPRGASTSRGQRVGVIGTGLVGHPVDPDHRRAGRRADRVPAHRRPSRCRPGTSRSTRSRSKEIKADYAEFRAAEPADAEPPSASRIGAPTGRPSRSRDEERRAEFERRWEQGGLAVPRRLQRPAARQDGQRARRPSSCGSKLREIVEDPEVAGKLTPDQVVGCKRLCVDTGYYATFNRPQRAPRRPPGDADRGDHPDRASAPRPATTSSTCIVFATGFDAMTGALLRIDIRGRGGRHARRTRGRPAPAPTSASAWRASPTCSPSPARAARRCSPT